MRNADLVIADWVAYCATWKPPRCSKPANSAAPIRTSLTIRHGAAFAVTAPVNEKTALLQRRTHDFFVGVIGLCRSLPQTPEGASISRQLLDSAGSTDSNYRAACRARSPREFIAKIGIALEEADESLGWLQALSDAQIGDPEAIRVLLQEANELTAIFVASRKTAVRNQRAPKDRKPREHR